MYIFFTILLLLLNLFDVAVGHPTELTPRGPQNFRWAALGDSWASGVRWTYWNANNHYDDDANCLRVDHAYSAQMQRDTSWATSQTLEFVACSGARYDDIILGQIGATSGAQLVTLTVGGNDIGFFSIATNCIYQQNKEINYGPEFDQDSDCVGMCCQAIKTAANNIQSTLDQSIQRVLLGILRDAAGKNPDGPFLLYLTGYAHFFNVDDTSTWCNNETFGAYPSFWPGQNGPHQPKLTLGLRRAINNLTQQINDKYAQNVANVQLGKNQHVGFVDISPAWSDSKGGHRFCEENMQSHHDQYYNKDLWFWNVSPTIFSSKDIDANPPHTLEALRETTIFNISETSMFDYSSGNDANAAFLRPFHPTEEGHGAIKDLIIARILADKAAQKLQF